jgi:hypothetical protein
VNIRDSHLPALILSRRCMTDGLHCIPSNGYEKGEQLLPFFIV